MAQYEGIQADSLFLLAENRFQDSKAFYEDHKPQLKRGVVEPLKHLMADMVPSMYAIDPLLGSWISRVRRDNRFTKDKLMYRENMWLVFLRDKRAWNWSVPAFYIDFSLNGVEWGMGFYSVTPSIMKCLRRRVEAEPKRAIKAIRQAQRAGFALDGTPYARPRSTPDIPKELRPLYDCRQVGFSRTESPDFMTDTTLGERLVKGFTALAPMYSLFIEAMEEDFGIRRDGNAEQD